MSIRSFRRAQARREARHVRRATLLARGGRLVAGTTLAAGALATGTAHAAGPYVVNTAADGAVDSPNPCSTSGTAGCTIRDALSLANSDGGGSTISFDAALDGQTITLTNGSLPISATGVTVAGPGAAQLTIDGGYNAGTAGSGSQVFAISTAEETDSHVTISGLTLTHGDAVNGSGGAVSWGVSPSSPETVEPLTLDSDVITNSHADDDGGGVFSNGPISVSNTTISGNTAGQSGGGISATEYNEIDELAPLTLTNSNVTGNTAGQDGGGVDLKNEGKYATATQAHSVISGSMITGNSLTDSSGSTFVFGGGVDAFGASVTITGSSVSDNSAAPQNNKGIGGGVFSGTKYGTEITSSTLSGNTASAGGGGLSVGADDSFGSRSGIPSGATQKYSPTTVDTTTVSGNSAPDGAGIQVLGLQVGSPMLINRSTISGNNGGSGSYGGGIALDQLIGSPFQLRNSTVSGNTADNGGGISLGNGQGYEQFPQTNGETTGSVGLENSTISGNSATTAGGGAFLGSYSQGDYPGTRVLAPVVLDRPGLAKVVSSDAVTPSTTSTDAAPPQTIGLDSTIVAANKVGSANNDLQLDTGSTGGFSGDFNLVQSPGTAPLTGNSNILGQDPQLSALANNGGPTETMKPSGTSPVIDQGHRSNGETIDQTGNARTVDTGVPNPANGDGTDIGAVELAASDVNYTPPPTTTTTTTTTTSTSTSNPGPINPGFRVGVRTTLTLPGSPLGTGVPLLVGSQTPVTCTVQVGTLHTCLIELRVGNKVIASGAATDRQATSTITSLVELNNVGAKLIKNDPLGVTVPATANTDAPGAPFIDGNVHFLPSNAITLPLVGRKTTLSSSLKSQLKQAASLLSQTKTVGCTAYSDKSPTQYRLVGAGRHRHKVALPNPDFTLTKQQAKAVCSTLSADGLKAKVSYLGRGYHGEIASDRTASGRAQNRRVVITFRF